MNFYFLSFLSFSILLPGILAVVFFKKISKSYYPFLFCTWLGCFNEVLSFFLALHHRPTLLNNNIYVLAESILLALFLHKKDLLSKKWFLVLATLFIMSWSAENLVFSSIFANSTYFRIFYSLTLTLCSLRGINRILSFYQRKLLQNSTFLLCLAFTIYFTYKAFILSVVIYGLTQSTTFLTGIYIIMIYINLGVNLVYTLAVLWMPKNLGYSSPLLLRSL